MVRIQAATSFLLFVLIFIFNSKALAENKDEENHLGKVLDEVDNFDIDEPHIQINFTGAYSTRRNFTNEEIALMDDIEFDTAVGSNCDSKLWSKWVGIIFNALECSENHEYGLRKASELENEIRDEAIYLILGYTGAEIQQIRKTNKRAKIKPKGSKDKAIKFLKSLCMSRKNRFLYCSAKSNTCSCPIIPNAWIKTENVGGICKSQKCSICDVPELQRAATTTPSTPYAKIPFSGPIHCSDDLRCEVSKSDKRRWFCRDIPPPTTPQTTATSTESTTPTTTSTNSSETNATTETAKTTTPSPDSISTEASTTTAEPPPPERKKRQIPEESDEDLDLDEDEDDEENEVLNRIIRRSDDEKSAEEFQPKVSSSTILTETEATTEVSTAIVNETTGELNASQVLDENARIAALDENEAEQNLSTTEPPYEECPMDIVISKIPCYFSGKMPDGKKNGGNIIYTGYLLWGFLIIVGFLAN